MEAIGPRAKRRRSASPAGLLFAASARARRAAPPLGALAAAKAAKGDG